MRRDDSGRAGRHRPAGTPATGATAATGAARSVVAAAAAAALGIFGLAAGCGGTADDQRPPLSQGQSADEQPAQLGPGAVGQPGDPPTGAVAAGVSSVADPVRIMIADIGVSAPVVPLGLDANRRLEAPTGFDETGWNLAGPEPGEPGAAVVAGHVDSHYGPAVFYRLRELQPGAVVTVERADGTSATFRVDRLAVYPKDDFPSEEVYVGNGRPELRLITCGGEFDTGRRSYVDNVVVFASEFSASSVSASEAAG